MSKLRGIQSGKKSINQRVIDLLTGTLERAQAGEVNGVAMILDTIQGLESRFEIGDAGTTELIGSLEMMKHAVMTEVMQ